MKVTWWEGGTPANATPRALCAAGDAVAVVGGELHTAMHVHEVDDPRDLVGRAFSHRLGEVALEPAPVRGRRPAEKVLVGGIDRGGDELGLVALWSTSGGIHAAHAPNGHRSLICSSNNCSSAARTSHWSGPGSSRRDEHR
jgi:hypothetical protein